MKGLLLAALLAFLAGMLLGSMLALAKKQGGSRRQLRSVTRILFVSIAISAITWVFISYAIAIYATVRLGQVYTMSELSEPAITGILCTAFLKVLENIFEHNDGALFGHSNRKEK